MDLLLEPAGLGDRGPTPSFWEKTLLLSLPLGTARGSLKVHSTGQTAQWLQGPAPPASASLMQERKGVRSLGPLSRPREVARAEAEGGQEASFLSPSSLAGLRAQTGKGPVSAQGARRSTHSHVRGPRQPPGPLLCLPGFVAPWSYDPSSLGLLTD